jgi:hypothetical protein
MITRVLSLALLPGMRMARVAAPCTGLDTDREGPPPTASVDWVRDLPLDTNASVATASSPVTAAEYTSAVSCRPTRAVVMPPIRAGRPNAR